jgi:hypothetical protein
MYVNAPLLHWLTHALHPIHLSALNSGIPRRVSGTLLYFSTPTPAGYLIVYGLLRASMALLNDLSNSCHPQNKPDDYGEYYGECG